MESNTVRVNGTTLKQNVILNTIFRILMVLAPFVTAPYISRVLLSDGVGIFSYTQSLVTYFTMFAALGTVSYGTREISRNRDNKDSYSKSFWEIELVSVICSLIAIVAWLILAVLYSTYTKYLLIFSVLILATCFDISWLYAGLEKYIYTISINLIFKIAAVVLTFVLVKTADDLLLYIALYSASIFLGNLSMWLFLPKILSNSKPDLKNLKRHFKETSIYFIPAIATSMYTVLDKTLIGALIAGDTTAMVGGEEIIKKTSELESGYYEQSTKIIDILKILCFASIHTVVNSRANYLYKIKSDNEIENLSYKTLEITLFLSIGAAFGVTILSTYFVPIYFGPGYEKTIVLLKIMAFLIPIISISGTIGAVYYTPSGKRLQSSLFLIIGGFINLLLSIPMIIFFKSIGAAIASLCAEIIIVVLYFAYCKKTITIKRFLMVVWKKILAGLIMMLTLLLFINLAKNIINNPYIFLITSMFIGLFIYLSVLIILKDKTIKYVFNFFKRKNYEKQNISKV